MPVQNLRYATFPVASLYPYRHIQGKQVADKRGMPQACMPGIALVVEMNLI